ncbi:hypothetical protein [Limnospira fusiformis]
MVLGNAIAPSGGERRSLFPYILKLITKCNYLQFRKHLYPIGVNYAYYHF